MWRKTQPHVSPPLHLDAAAPDDYFSVGLDRPRGGCGLGADVLPAPKRSDTQCDDKRSATEICKVAKAIFPQQGNCRAVEPCQIDRIAYARSLSSSAHTYFAILAKDSNNCATRSMNYNADDRLLTLAQAADLLGMKASGLRTIVARTKHGTPGPQIQFFQIGQGPIKFRRAWIERFIEENSTKPGQVQRPKPQRRQSNLTAYEEMMRDPEQRAFWANLSYDIKRCPQCHVENKVRDKPDTVTCEKCGEVFWFDRRRAEKPPKQRRLDEKKKGGF